VETAWILVIEDDALDRKLIRRGLKCFEQDYALVELSSPAPLIDLVAAKSAPAVAIVDQHLLGMSGPEIVSFFRESGRWTHVPVVLISNGEAGNMPDDVYFLYKPMIPEDFIDVLQTSVRSLLA